MTSLLPCPFCGGEAHISVSSDGYGIECANDRCLDMIFDQLPSEEEAISAWNTRADRTCHNDAEKWQQFFNGYYFVCSECAWNLPNVGNDGIELAAALIRQCPECGARVKEES